MLVEEKDDIITFINACNDFIDGKFILADIKISKILKSISNSKNLYDLIAECMINYDFEKAFENAKIGDKNTTFTLPYENHKVIPFVFCLLVEIDSKKLNFNEFLSTQFPLATNQNEEYLSFGKTAIIPFRNAIAEVFNIEIEKENEENKAQQEENILDKKILEKENTTSYYEDSISLKPEEGISPLIEEEIKMHNKEEEELSLLFDRVVRITGILDDKLLYIKNPLKKSNFALVIDALYEACMHKSVKIVVALVMSINNIAGNEKHIRQEIKELNTICYNFYEK